MSRPCSTSTCSTKVTIAIASVSGTKPILMLQHMIAQTGKSHGCSPSLITLQEPQHCSKFLDPVNHWPLSSKSIVISGSQSCKYAGHRLYKTAHDFIKLQSLINVSSLHSYGIILCNVRGRYAKVQARFTCSQNFLRQSSSSSHLGFLARFCPAVLLLASHLSESFRNLLTCLWSIFLLTFFEALSATCTFDQPGWSLLISHTSFLSAVVNDCRTLPATASDMTIELPSPQMQFAMVNAEKWPCCEFWTSSGCRLYSENGRLYLACFGKCRLYGKIASIEVSTNAIPLCIILVLYRRTVSIITSEAYRKSRVCNMCLIAQ